MQNHTPYENKNTNNVFFLPDHQGIQQVSPKKYLNTTYVMAAFE